MTTINGFPVPSFETVTPVGLYIMLVLLLYFERIVPIGRVRDAQKAAEILRQAGEKKDATIDKQAETINILTKEIAATVTKVMGEIQAKAGVDK
jgi:hypothetical protein